MADRSGSRMTVQVVIPAYQASATIADCVKSVLRTTDESVRVLVMVDGASDDTEQIVRHLIDQEETDSRVAVVARADNRGAQATRNEGLASITERFVMFLDADDRVEGPLISGLADALQNEGADVAFGPFRHQEADSERILRTFAPDFASSADLFWRWFGHSRWKSARSDMVPPCAVMWNAAFLREIGGWDESVARNQDGELVIRAVLRGARIANSAKGCGVYLRHPGESSISMRSDKLESLLQVSDKVLHTPSEIISAQDRLIACAAHDYGIAWRCFEAGRDDLGRRALARSRARGFRGNWGNRATRLFANIFGLPLRFKMTRFLKRIHDRPDDRRRLTTPDIRLGEK